MTTWRVSYERSMIEDELDALKVSHRTDGRSSQWYFLQEPQVEQIVGHQRAPAFWHGTPVALRNMLQAWLDCAWEQGLRPSGPIADGVHDGKPGEFYMTSNPSAERPWPEQRFMKPGQLMVEPPDPRDREIELLKAHLADVRRLLFGGEVEYTHKAPDLSELKGMVEAAKRGEGR